VEQKLMMPTLVVSDIQDAKPIPPDFLVQEKRYVSILDIRSRVKFVSTNKIKYLDAPQGEYVDCDLKLYNTSILLHHILFILLISPHVDLSLHLTLSLLILLYLSRLTFSLRLVYLMYLFISLSPSHFKLSYSLHVSITLLSSFPPLSSSFLLFPQIKT